MTQFNIRRFLRSDGQATLDLFRETIRQINIRDYSPAQVTAWASDDLSLSDWTRRFDDKDALVVMKGHDLVGFADMAFPGGESSENGLTAYLDRLFVSANHQRQGIATLLLNELIAAAEMRGVSRIDTEASITAKPFFLHNGFRETCEQRVECRGQTLTNFKMELLLG